MVVKRLRGRGALGNLTGLFVKNSYLNSKTNKNLKIFRNIVNNQSVRNI